ncbi:MAG: hypothetical protein M3173_06045 [Chloroflexota bacterium]|nr:hypothetical protein [Chloroflexota bacterium]
MPTDDLTTEEVRLVSQRRTLLPGRGNPMRPVLILIAAFFGLLLVVFPVIMQVAGVGAAGTVGMALLIVAVAVLCLAIQRAVAGAYEEGRESMLAGETLASWRLAPDEHRRFLVDERQSNQRTAAYGLGGLALGAVLGVSTDDWLLGGIMICVFLIAATVILTMAGPRRDAGSESGREVVIGTQGVQLLGRYLPFHAPLMRLHDTELRFGDPAVLFLRIRTGYRLEEVRVPVPRDRMPEAEALVERLNAAAST